MVLTGAHVGRQQTGGGMAALPAQHQARKVTAGREHQNSAERRRVAAGECALLRRDGVGKLGCFIFSPFLKLKKLGSAYDGILDTDFISVIFIAL